MSLETNVLYESGQVTSPLWVSVPFSGKRRNRTEWVAQVPLSTPELLSAPGIMLGASQQAREPLWLGPVAAGSFHVVYLVLGESLTEQGGEPIDIGFTVWVQECDDIPNCRWGPQHPGPYQPFPFLGSENPHAGEMGHVVFKRLLQVLWEGDRRGKWTVGKKSCTGKGEESALHFTVRHSSPAHCLTAPSQCKLYTLKTTKPYWKELKTEINGQAVHVLRWLNIVKMLIRPPILIYRVNVIKITADFFAEIDNWQLILKFMKMQGMKGPRIAKTTFLLFIHECL